MNNEFQLLNAFKDYLNKLIDEKKDNEKEHKNIVVLASKSIFPEPKIKFYKLDLKKFDIGFKSIINNVFQNVRGIDNLRVYTEYLLWTKLKDSEKDVWDKSDECCELCPCCGGSCTKKHSDKEHRHELL